jgi:hypothetical protein
MLAYLNECEYLCLDCAGDISESYHNVYDMDSEESDCPQNCAVCHTPLGNALTMDGVRYILEAMRDSLRDGRSNRNLVHDCYKGTYWEGSRHCEIVRDWAEQIKWYGGLSDRDESFVAHYLSWTEK